MDQEIRFCRTRDGVRLAYAVAGQGPPLVKTANWLNHLEHDWDSLVWRHVLTGLASRHRLLRYDERGNGLSDWNVEDISFEAFVEDLETVVDAAGVDRFALFGVSQGCAVSIAYTVRHPERVSRLVLFGGYAQGWRRRGDPVEIEQREALKTLVRQGWGRENPAFRQIFTSLFFPDGTAEQMRAFNELQRVTASPENAVRLLDAFSLIDVTHLLGQVSVPTLVLHCRDDARVPFESGRAMAAGIPDARFVPLASRNHLILEDDPAWPRFMGEITSFLAGDADPDLDADDPSTLTARPAPPESWQEVDRLFDEALDVSPAERAAWLDERCAGRPALRARLERLLEATGKGDALLRTGGALAGSVGKLIAEAAADAALSPGKRLGSYEIVESIGSGGMGEVFRARHERLGRDVAVKALAGLMALGSDALRRFEREARLAASLAHPNIATVYDYMIVEGRPYLVLELIEGESLSERIDRGPLPCHEALAIALQLVDALAEAHGKGIVHRDLKPSNIKITPRRGVKVLDFGLAKAVAVSRSQPDGDSSFATASLAVLGTPGYMSPEQARGEAIDTRTDIWAFGCVLYEMLSGRKAFDANTLSDSIAAVLRDEPDWGLLPPATPAAVVRLLQECLAKDADGRPPGIEQVRAVIEQVGNDTAGGA